MTDILLESVRVLLVLLLFVLLWRMGRGRLELKREGWSYILGGFGLLLFGSVLDVTDNFAALERFVIVGDTLTEAFLEKFVGYIGGFALLAIGLVRWIPIVQRASTELRERLQTEEFLVQSEERFKDFAESAADWFWEMDADLKYAYLSERYETLTGVSPEKLLGKTRREIYTGLVDSQKDAWQQHFAILGAHQSFRDFVYSYRRPNGEWRTFRSAGTALFDENGQFLGYRGTGSDITEQQRIERELFEEKERALVTLHSIGDAVITTSADGEVQYLNPVAEAMTGWLVEQAKDQPLAKVFNIINEQTHEHPPDPVARCLNEGRAIGLANHTVLISRDGTEYAIEDSAAPIRDRDGHVLGVVLVFKDATESRHMAQQIEHQANHDALTGLINRREFERRLERVLQTAREEPSEHALCYLDLDQFKIINDTCGHVAGDELLRQLGALLEERVRKRDTLARLGGDEFGLLMEHCSLGESQRVANNIRKAIEDFRFLWEEKSFNVGVSIGLVPINEAGGTTVGVLSAADSACYTAKDEGRNRVHVYREDDSEAAKRHGEMQWVGRIQQALEENRFELWFQSIGQVTDVDDAGAHYELLIRMCDEDGNSILPGSFLPAAERYNLSVKIDRWVVRTALEWLYRNPSHVQRLHLCSINLSGHSLADEEFLDFVIQQLTKTKIPPHNICFEVTETAAIANLSRATRFIKALKDRGCRFSLDDFGSGVSSFAYLKNLPVDYLKIDGQFVKDIVDDPIDLAMVQSINDIGRVMGKLTIAEFVESDEILDRLRTIGVDYAQGYAIDKPKPIDELICPLGMVAMTRSL